VSQFYESIRKRKYITVFLLVKLEQHGYLGLFLISLLAGSPIPVPTPIMILTFTLGSLLNPLLIGLVAGLGNTIGNAFIYYTGRSGLKVISGFDKPDTKLSRFLGNKRISNILNSRGWGEMAMVFLLFMYPNPVATPLILAMGATRFNLTRFLVICWSAKTVQGLIFAYLGHFGLRSLLRFLGVFNA
jgi:membrane protein YqaA with SNARE-associated domain